MARKKDKPMTFSQFAYCVVKGRFKLVATPGVIAVIGGGGRSIEIHENGKGVYSWQYTSKSKEASQDWDRAFNRLKMTKDEWGWRELCRAAEQQGSPVVLQPPQGGAWDVSKVEVTCCG